MANRIALFQRREPTHAPSWHRLGWVALLVGALLVNLPAHARPVPGAALPFTIGVDAEPDSYASRWFSLIYSEVFRRLDLPLLIENYSLKRRELQADSGDIDGEANRAYGYGATHPNLIRVEESVIDLSLALYTANPALHLQRLDELSTNNMMVEYRRGILVCENALKSLVTVDRLSDVLAAEQGVKKLLAGRTDLYCDFDLAVQMAIRTPGMNSAGKIRTAIDIGKSIPTYPYLHKKHVDLAPRMASVLKKMKAEGLIEAYRLQTERELGIRK